MSGRVIADTHALIWYLFEPAKLSTAARQALDGAAKVPLGIVVSAISLIELRYLVEKQRVAANALQRVEGLVESTASIAVAPVDLALSHAMGQVPRIQVPDLPDRVIASTAVLLGLPLVSRDRKIVAAGVGSVW